MVNKKYLHEPLILNKKEIQKSRPSNEETEIFWRKINEEIKETDTNNEKQMK